MQLKRTALATAAVMSLGTAGTAAAELTMQADNGWEFGVGGLIPVFVTSADYEDSDRNEFDVGSGFNPATMNLRVSAPEQNGLDVSGMIGINNHVGSGGNNFNGFGGRIARLTVGGDFGTVHIGQTFGLFGTPAIGDAGSAKGIGGRGLRAQNATLGRIGVGYFYTDFEPQVQFVSNRSGGVGFAASIVRPDTVTPNDEVSSPRFEARLDYSGDVLGAWVSGGYQQVDVVNSNNQLEDATMTGVDVGGSLNLGRAALRANFSRTEGTGGIVFGNASAAQTIAEEEYDQYYVEGTFATSSNTTLGVSYGEGGFESYDEDRELLMLFGRYQATDSLTLMAEVQDHEGAVSNGGVEGPGSYDAISVGAQLTF